MPLHFYLGFVDYMLDLDLESAFQRMITHCFAVTDAEEAFAVAGSGKLGKVLFVWNQVEVRRAYHRQVAERFDSLDA